MRRIAAVVAASFLVAVPTAVASDDTVYQAWITHDDEFVEHGEEVRKGLRAWERSGRANPDRAYRAIDDTRRTLAGNTRDTSGEEPSSDKGAEAKKLALKSNSVFDLALAKLRKAVKLGTRGDKKGSNRAFEEADALLIRSGRYGKRARAAFKAAGVTLKS